MPSLTNDTDVEPLEFWQNQCQRLPKLSQIARSVFAIPATQNRTERSFSAAGLTVNRLRTCLDPEHVDDLLTIRSYYRQANGEVS